MYRDILKMYRDIFKVTYGHGSNKVSGLFTIIMIIMDIHPTEEGMCNHILKDYTFISLN